MATKNGESEKKFTGDPVKDSKEKTERIGKQVEEGFEFRDYDPKTAKEYNLDIEIARAGGDDEEVKRLQEEKNQYIREGYYSMYNGIDEVFRGRDIELDYRIENAKTREERNALKQQKLANIGNHKSWKKEADKFKDAKTESYVIEKGGYSPTYGMGAGGSGDKIGTREVFDYEGMENAILSSLPDEQLPQKEFEDQYVDDGSGTYVRKDYGFKRLPMMSYKKNPKGANPFNISEITRESEILDAPKETDTPKLNTEVERDEFQYQDTTTDGIGLIDYLQPATQLLTGLVGAAEPLPDPTMSPEMRTIIDEDMARRNQGLSPDEIDYRNRQSERGYAYDVQNIANMSGGSAGMALANLGRAAGTLQGQYSRTAAEDEAMRRQNRAYARQSAGLAEDFERYDFGIQYDEAMMDAQAAGALAQTGMQEFTDLRQYQRNYGEGSPYLEYMRLLNKEKALSNFESEQLSKNIPALLQYRSNQGIIKQEEAQSNDEAEKTAEKQKQNFEYFYGDNE